MPHGDPLGPVVIGPREIYDAVVRVGNAVERLTDQHADTAADVATHETQLRVLAPVPSQVADHETRVRALEDAQPSRRLTRLEEQVEALKAARWPLPALAVVLSAGALGLGLIEKLTN